MPSFDAYQVFVTEDRVENRPRAVFSSTLAKKQAYRSYQFPSLSDAAEPAETETARRAVTEGKAELERRLEVEVARSERQGREAGLEEARREHAAERAQLMERMEGALSALNLALDRAEEAATRDALRLGLMIAERLTRVCLSTDPAALAKTLAASVGKLDGDGPVKLVASPELAARLGADLQAVAAQLEVDGIDIEGDETLQPGDLLVYRGSSTLDARVLTRLRRVESRLLEELGFDKAPGAEP